MANFICIQKWIVHYDVYIRKGIFSDLIYFSHYLKVRQLAPCQNKPHTLFSYVLRNSITNLIKIKMNLNFSILRIKREKHVHISVEHIMKTTRTVLSQTEL